MRIFIGMEEIAGFTKNYASGMNALGHDVFTVVNYISYYQDFKYDVVLKGDLAKFLKSNLFTRIYLGVRKKIYLFILLWWSLFRYDVFIFIFGTSFLPACIDYALLKFFRKKIVCVFLGSDIRYGPAVKIDMEEQNMAEEIRPFLDYLSKIAETKLSFKLHIIKMSEKYADIILSQPGYGQLQSRPYMRANVPIELAGIIENIPERQTPLIIHAPTQRGIKGTEYILSTIDELRNEGFLFEFRLIEKMPNHELKQLLSEADIVIDDLFADTIGVFSLEALAAGNVVLVHYPEVFAKVPEGCPAVNINMFTLKDSLKEIILSKERRRLIASKGRVYVEKYHSHITIARQILEWLQPNGISDYTFTPTSNKSYNKQKEKK